jgi:uncharacterized membrane protein YeaQ/YmgE (transglycosylase-associated protein family)
MPTMEQLQPYMPYILMAANGLIAGWIASLLLGGGGLIRALVVGVIGAILGGALVRHGLLTLPFTTNTAFGDQVIVSTIGAIAVILIARFLGGR